MTTAAKDFERFRDFHVHQIILHILNSEFNLDLYKKKGIIEDHFPVHKVPVLKNIHEKWKGSTIWTYFQSFRINTKPKDLRQVHCIAFYYGCPYGFYMGFNAVYISWLIIVALLGLAFTLKLLLINEPFDNYLTPVYAIVITVWLTIVHEKWKQRESELTFMWNALKFKLNENSRIDYIGYYGIDKASKTITETKPARRWSKLLVS